MRRGVVLGAVLTVGALSLAAAYQAPSPKVVEVEKLRDNLYVLKGGGGNSSVFIGANGVTVVDTKNPGWGQPILEMIKGLTSKPVTTIINTHTHGDHVSGNVEFPATVDIVAHENTAASMQKMIPNSSAADQTPPAQTIFQAHGGRGLVKRTFQDRMTIGSGADEIDLYYFGRGHTGGDAWVVFPSLRVVHAADMFPGKQTPIVDGNNGGSGIAYPDTLTRAHTTLKNIETVITGHSTQMTWADVQEYADFNRDFLAMVQAGIKAGKTADAIAAGYTVPQKYAGYTADPGRVKTNVLVMYSELKK